MYPIERPMFFLSRFETPLSDSRVAERFIAKAGEFALTLLGTTSIHQGL